MTAQSCGGFCDGVDEVMRLRGKVRQEEARLGCAERQLELGVLDGVGQLSSERALT